MDNNLPQNNFPISNQPTQKPSVWVSNPNLKLLLGILIFVFLACGIGLAVFAQWSSQYRQQVYEQTKAGLPVHQEKVTTLAPTVLADGRLQVDSPKEGDAIGQTFTVSGYAQDWFEGNIAIKVFDASNTPLFIGSTIAGDNYGHPAPFNSSIILTATSTTPAGKIEFNDYSAKDGSLVYQKVVNIKFVNIVTIMLGWKYYSGHTAYGEQYTFSLQYPENWSLGEFNGSKALIKGKCAIVPGAGGHGMEGYPVPKVEYAIVDGLKATIQTWSLAGSDALVNTQIMSGNNDYIFDLNYPSGQTQCLIDFKNILNTVKINK